MDLLDQNAGIFILLPSLVQDLYTQQSQIDVTKNYINRQITKFYERHPAIARDLQTAAHQLNVFSDSEEYNLNTLVVDNNKTISLSFLLGNIFTDAVEILSRRENIQIYNPRNDSLDTYWARGVGRVMVGVIHPHRTLKKTSIGIELEIVQLELNELLYKLDLVYRNHHLSQCLKLEVETLSQQDTHRKSVLYEYHQTQDVTDLFNWYCSCSQYQSGYTHNWVNQSRSKFINNIHTSPHPLFESIKFDQIDALPICCHLVCLLIIRANPKADLYTFTPLVPIAL